MPNATFRICPRGFANEVTYLRVPADKIEQVDALFGGYNDSPNASALWVPNNRTHPRNVIAWEDRKHADPLFMFSDV